MVRCDVHPTSERGIARDAGSMVMPLVPWNSLELPARVGVVDEVERLDGGSVLCSMRRFPERSNVPAFKRSNAAVCKIGIPPRDPRPDN